MRIQPMEFLLNPNNIEEKFLIISDEIIPNVKPWYFISDFGNVYSAYSNRLLKPTISTDGYNVCTLRTNDEKGITIYIHRTEMLVFKYEPGCELLDVDHVDCNKSNNRINNLEWVTTGENTRRAAANGLLLMGENAPWTKVTDIMVHQICALYVDGHGISDIARTMNCGLDSVFRIVHGIGRTNISSQYDIESRYRGYLSDSDIHTICNTYSSMKGIPYIKIKQFLSKILPINIDKNIDGILRNLYRHDIYCYYRISSQYDY